LRTVPLAFAVCTRRSDAAPRGSGIFNFGYAGDGSDIGAYELSAPSLTIARSGNNSVLSWSTLGTGFRLQSVTNLVASNKWVNVNGAALVLNHRFYVTNTTSAQQDF
jgi:hypothetical protein